MEDTDAWNLIPRFFNKNEEVELRSPNRQLDQIPIRVRSIATKDINYDTSNWNIGTALIFNHKEIPYQEPRRGSEHDRDRLKSVLTEYGFDVRTFDDLTFEELKIQLENVAREDHSDNDCLVVVVMSHGIEGKIFAKDKTYPVECLWTPFLGENCKTLIDKPKLFIIQACRGNQLEKPVIYMRSRSQLFASPNIDENETWHESEIPIPTKTITYAIPNTADLLLYYSTFYGYCSFRCPENGSWFIQAFCQAFKEAVKNSPEEGTELYKLLTTINRKVAYEYQSMTKEEATSDMKEMPNFVSTLTKMFYLKVKKKHPQF